MAVKVNSQVNFPCVSPDILIKMHEHQWKAREDGTTIWLQLYSDEGELIEEIPFGNVCYNVLLDAYREFTALINEE